MKHQNPLMRELCQQLLRNDALKQVLTDLHKSYMMQLISSQPDAGAEREALYHKINAGEALLQMVENYGR
jgi:hypothetical protein